MTIGRIYDKTRSAGRCRKISIESKLFPSLERKLAQNLSGEVFFLLLPAFDAVCDENIHLMTICFSNPSRFIKRKGERERRELNEKHLNKSSEKVERKASGVGGGGK